MKQIPAVWALIAAVAVFAVASLWQGFRNSEAKEQACASRGWRYTEGRGMAACIDQSGIMREIPARRNGA